MTGIRSGLGLLRSTAAFICRPVFPAIRLQAKQIGVRNYAVRPEVSQAERLTSIGTRAIFSAEHDTFRQSVRLFFEKEVMPYHSNWEEQGFVDREVTKHHGSSSSCPRPPASPSRSASLSFFLSCFPYFPLLAVIIFQAPSSFHA